MKYFVKLSIFSLILIGLTASTKKKEDYKLVNVYHKFMAAPFEVTNGEYKVFLDHLENKGKLALLKAYTPKSELWLTAFKGNFNKPMAEKYASHPAYNNYPVVNITQAAAEAYCQFKTEQYNLDPKREYNKVVFSLPTEHEWKELANPYLNSTFPWIDNSAFYEGKKGKYFARANLKYINYTDNSTNFIADGGFYPIKGGVYPANKLGIYDVIGNVAELTSEGYVKGGSWNHTIEESGVDKRQNVSAPHPCVGFRMVMKIDKTH